jgi:hypothetical protein
LSSQRRLVLILAAAASIGVLTGAMAQTAQERVNRCMANADMHRRACDSAAHAKYPGRLNAAYEAASRECTRLGRLELRSCGYGVHHAAPPPPPSARQLRVNDCFANADQQFKRCEAAARARYPGRPDARYDAAVNDCVRTGRSLVRACKQTGPDGAICAAGRARHLP